MNNQQTDHNNNNNFTDATPRSTESTMPVHMLRTKVTTTITTIYKKKQVITITTNNNYYYSQRVKAPRISSSSPFSSTNAKYICTTSAPQGIVIIIVLINYCESRVGNPVFAQYYNKHIPCSYRIVVDGDLVTNLPPTKYKHVGTEILIDGVGHGVVWLLLLLLLLLL